ncbi:MAG: dockerin type I domain-containing protein [Pyrinomonadaceae bacterium]
MISVKTRSYLLLSAQFFAVSFLMGLLLEVFLQNSVIAAGDMASATPTAVPTGSPAINGMVRYGNAIGSPSSRLVSNVLLTAVGPLNANAMTGFPGGTYSLTGLSEGSYTVTPTKTGGVNGSINSFDAAKVAQHVTGLNFLAGNQLIAADVSGNGTVSSFDAGQVARFVVALPGGMQTGTWKFILASNSYPAVTGSYNGEDYFALLMGEVSGNWNDRPSPTNTSTSTPTNTPTATPTSTPTLPPTPISTPTGSNIALYPSIRYQTMRGWEAVGEAGQFYSPAWNNYKNALLDQTVNDLGLNRIRLEIKSGIENPVDYFTQWQSGQITENQYNAKRYEIINDNSSSGVVNPSGFQWASLDRTIEQVVNPLRQRLQARGETLWVNVNYVDFGSSAFEHKNDPAEYAEFVLAAFQHMQSAYGFVPDSWEVILEPDNPAAGWSSSQTANAIKAAGDRLAASGFTPNFVAPATTSASNAPAYIDRIAATTGAMQYVSEFSYHRYDEPSDATVAEIADRAVLHNKRTGMLEWIGADYNTIHSDLKLGRNSSWQQFCLAGPTSWGPEGNGERYYVIDDTNVSSPVIIMATKTKFLRQYFKFIRAGAQRIEALTGNGNFDPLAFINTNGKYVVVVKASASGAFNVQGLPAGLYGIKYTTNSQYNIDLADVSISTGQVLSATMPASGVITVYAK